MTQKSSTTIWKHALDAYRYAPREAVSHPGVGICIPSSADKYEHARPARTINILCTVVADEAVIIDDDSTFPLNLTGGIVICLGDGGLIPAALETWRQARGSPATHTQIHAPQAPVGCLRLIVRSSDQCGLWTDHA